MRIRTLFFGLMIFCSLAAHAQKLKEKKDIVYLDDVPQYKIEKSAGNLLKGISYLVTSLTTDTLIRFNFKSIRIPELPHEGIGTFWSYYLVDFSSLGKSVEIGPTGKRDMMDQLQEHHVIADGKVSPEGADKFMAANQAFQKSREAMDSLVLLRKALASDKAYKEYSKTLAPRSRWDEDITLSGNDIMMGTVKIGSWKIGTDSDYGKMHHILKPNGKQAASIFFEKGRQRTYTRTELDNKGREAFIQSDFTFGHLIAEIKWLVTNGYL